MSQHPTEHEETLINMLIESGMSIQNEQQHLNILKSIYDNLNAKSKEMKEKVMKNYENFDSREMPSVVCSWFIISLEWTSQKEKCMRIICGEGLEPWVYFCALFQKGQPVSP